MKRSALAALAVGAMTFGTVIGTAMAAPIAQGVVPHYIVVEKTFVAQPATPRTFTINCPAGRMPIAGGGHAGAGSFFGSPAAGVYASDISLNHRGWTVSVLVGASYGATSFTADVVCATP